MGKTAGKLVALGAALAAVMAGASCSLNAQPEPPGVVPTGSTGGAAGANFPGTGGSTSAGAAGSGYTAGAGGGAGFAINDAAPAVTPGADAGTVDNRETDGGDGAVCPEASDGSAPETCDGSVDLDAGEG